MTKLKKSPSRAMPPSAKRDKPDMKVEGDCASPRMDRAGYKRGGAVKGKGTTVNVVIAPQGGGGGPPAPMPVPMPVRPPMPPPGLAGGAPMPPQGPMAGPPMRNGGRLTAGSGSALGRLQKMRMS